MAQDPRGLEALRHKIDQLSAELLRAAVDSLDGVLMALTVDGKILFSSRTPTGRGDWSVVGKNVLDFLPPLERELGRACLDRVSRTGVSETLEIDGSNLPVRLAAIECRVAPILEGEVVVGVTVLAADVSARRRADLAVRESEEKLRLSVAATGFGTWSWERRPDQITFDRTLCSIFGVTPETAPRDQAQYLALIHPDDRELLRTRLAQIIETRHHGRVEHRVLRPDGGVRWLMTIGTPVADERGDIVRLVGGAIEVTDRRQLQEQLHEARKMEAVGQLTAGIAHHFNNMLMGILPNIQMAAEGASPELAPLLRDAEQAAVRAAEMVKQLSRFAGRGKPQPRRLEDLGQLVEQTLSMCRETFDRRIDLRLQRDPSAPAVVAEAIEVEHALMNVLINARDAVSGPAVTRPQITISVERVAADAPEITEQPGARHVDHACVRITDNGVGMDAPTMERIYEPFFTTKGVGRGTGLGLSTTYSVVREHGGFIRCTSSVGRGTTFAIYLPAGEAVRPVNGARPTPGAVAAVAQRETILVVDDEPVVRSAVTRVLQSAGYRVETAGSGDEVLARYGAGINGIKLALVDVSMPGLAGPVLVQRLRERVGHLRVLYLTGYSMAAGPDPVVEKPVSPEALLRAVSDALAGP